MEAVLGLVFGLLIGSFLNVCIHRWPRGRSVVKPRSHCVRCRKIITWRDNIPVISYLLLGGKCRHCGKEISIRYPLVELMTGLLFGYFTWTLGLTALAAKMCVFGGILVALIFTDLEKRLLPDELTLGGTLVALVFSFFVPVPDLTTGALLQIFFGEFSPMWQSVSAWAVGALLPTFFLWFGGWIYEKVRHREGLGLGDVKLIAMVGGFMGLQNALLTLIIGSVGGAVIGYGYIKATGKDASTYELPFGTFLGIAALAAAVAGQKFLGAYGGV